MTAERLRHHWFGGERVPFWNYDPAQITIGIEVEYFIASGSESNFTLATKKQYLKFVERLIKNHGYKDHELPDQPGRVSKDTAHGFIAIKPDFAWHLLEIALPPRSNTEDIAKLLKEVFKDVDQCLGAEGLKRLDFSCLPFVPDGMEILDVDIMNQHRGKLSRVPPISPFSQDSFPALIASTQIHLNTLNEYSLRMLPTLYELDAIARECLCRQQNFLGFVSTNNREKMYEHSLGTKYELRTVPPEIPFDLKSYALAFNRTPKLFPGDDLSQVRDLSYVRPTKQGTFEFRSACSFVSLRDILNVATARVQQFLDAYSIVELEWQKGSDAKA